MTLKTHDCYHKLRMTRSTNTLDTAIINKLIILAIIAYNTSKENLIWCIVLNIDVIQNKIRFDASQNVPSGRKQ